LPKLAPLGFLSEPQENSPPEDAATVADASLHSGVSPGFEDERSASGREGMASAPPRYPLDLLLTARDACADSDCRVSLPKMLPLDFLSEALDTSSPEEIPIPVDVFSHAGPSPGLESKSPSVATRPSHDMKPFRQTTLTDIKVAEHARTGGIHCAFEMCPWIGSDIDYSMHVARCPCRPVSCPHYGCNWVGPFSSLLVHQSQCAPRMTVALRNEDDAYDNDVGSGARKKRELWRNARLREHGPVRISDAASKVGSSQQGRRTRRNLRSAPMVAASNKDVKMVRVECGPAYRLVPIAAPTAAPAARPIDLHSAPSVSTVTHRSERADLQPTIPDDLALEWALAASVDDAGNAAPQTEESCAICLEALCLESSSVVHLPDCKHAFHLLCVPTMQLPQSAAAGGGDALCAICRTPFTLAEVRPIKAGAPFAEAETIDSHASAKPAAPRVAEQPASTCKPAAPSAVPSEEAHEDEAGDEEIRSQSHHSLDVDERLLQEMEARLDAELGADVHNFETFGETKLWSFQENLAANLRNQEAQMSRASKDKGEGPSSTEVWLDRGMEISSQSTDAQAGSKWRASRHRVKLIRAIFHACNLAKNGRLTAAEMCKFASYTGFDGSDADWKTEYTMLCEDRGCKPDEGLECKDFVELVNDDSDIGCYCTTTELQSIHARLTD